MPTKKAEVEETVSEEHTLTPGGRYVGVTGAPGFAASPPTPEKIALPRGVGSSHPNTEIVDYNDPNEVAQPPFASYAEGIAAARAARNSPPQSRKDLAAMNQRRAVWREDPEEMKKLSRTSQPTVSGQELRRESPMPTSETAVVEKKAATKKTRGRARA